MILKPNILALNALVELANTLMALIAGAYDVMYTIIFSIANVIVVPVFLLMANLLNIVHIILLKAVTITPRALDGSGNTVIFGSPSNAPFSSLNTTINSYLEPISLLLILIGIAFLMFIRIFDVIIDDLGIDVQDAQNRLMLAPILILLWPVFANMILAIGHGFTELFLNITIEYDRDAFSEISDNISIPPWNQELDFRTYISSLAGNPLESSDTTLSMIFGILMMIIALIPYLLAMVAALFRIFAIYVLYVIGPILISMWAFAWRDLEEMGKRYIRYFFLLALFPVPAALINSLLPVLAFSVENALMAPLNDLPTGLLGMEASPTSPKELASSSTSAPSSFPTDLGVSGNPLAIVGLGGIVRAIMILVFPILVGFAPWVFVLGVDGAMKVAKGAGAATAAVATGGAAAGLAGSAIADKATGGKISSKAKSLGSKAIGEERSSKVGTLAGMGKKAAKNHRGTIQKGASRVAKSRGGRFSSMVGKGLERELEAEEAASKGRALLGDLKEGAELGESIGDGDITDEDQMALEERVMRNDMSTSRAKDIIKSSEDLDMNDFSNKSDEELQKIANQHKIEKYQNNTRDELRTEFGRDLERSMQTSFQDIHYRDMVEEARKLGVDDQVIQSNLSSQYADYDHGVHYNRMENTMTESNMSAEEENKARNDMAEASATLDNYNIDTDELAADGINSEEDLLKFLQGERKLEDSDSIAHVANSMQKFMNESDKDLSQTDKWREFDFFEQFDEVLSESNVDAEWNAMGDELNDKVSNNLEQIVENNQEDMAEVVETFIDESLFRQSASAEANNRFETSKEIDKNRLMKLVDKEKGKSDDAPLTDEARLAEGLRNADPDASNSEHTDIDETVGRVVKEVKEKHSEELASEMEEKIMNLEPSQNVSNIDLEVSSFENLGDAISETINDGLREANYSGDTLIDDSEINSIMSDFSREMQSYSEDAIEELAEQTSEMSEELISSAVQQSTDLDPSEKEELIDKYQEEGSLDSSDIQSMDMDQIDNLQRENLAKQFAEKRIAKVDEKLAEDLDMIDISEDYDNPNNASERIRAKMEQSDVDTGDMYQAVSEADEKDIEERDY